MQQLLYGSVRCRYIAFSGALMMHVSKQTAKSLPTRPFGSHGCTTSSTAPRHLRASPYSSARSNRRCRSVYFDAFLDPRRYAGQPSTCTKLCTSNAQVTPPARSPGGRCLLLVYGVRFFAGRLSHFVCMGSSTSAVRSPTYLYASLF